MRFVVDAQLPPRLALMFAAHGHEARHVAEFDMLRARDRAIWDKAREMGAVIVTKDRRLRHIAGIAIKRTRHRLDSAWKCQPGRAARPD